MPLVSRNASLSAWTMALSAIAVGLIVKVAAPFPAAAQSACPAASAAPSLVDAWIAAKGAHPLVGTIIRGREPLISATDVCSPGPLEQLRRALTEHLAAGGIVLLGEVHDNGSHHALRGHLLDVIATDLARLGRRPPAVVMEHLRTDQASVLGQAAPIPTGDVRSEAQSLLAKLDWPNSGWPSGELFLQIFEAAIAHRLPLLPGHPTRAEVRDVARKGVTALTAETIARLGLDATLPQPLADALLDELEASHCGLMPRTAFTNMALAQRYRDTHMATALVAAADKQGSAILLAGNGHVRGDRGVPWDFKRMMPSRKGLSVLLIEVAEGKTDVATYVEADPSGAPTADYIILTPRTERPDPCEAMRARFKKG